MAKILATAQQRGSANALRKPIELLINRGHEVEVYATGNDVEASGFGGLGYKQIHPISLEEYKALLSGSNLLLTGLSGATTSDSYFIQAANELGIKSVGVNDQNLNYRGRFRGVESLPTILAVMTADCGPTLERELDSDLSRHLIKGLRVVGWTAFDDYASIRAGFSPEQRNSLLEKLWLDSSRKISFHATQNVFVENNPNFLPYERRVTEEVFRKANDLGVSLVVKPHPKEAKNPSLADREITKALATKYGHIYLFPDSCETQKLMLSSDAVTAGRSTCLTEACLLDINTGGVLPDCSYDEIKAFPPVVVDAIPYTQSWEGIGGILKDVIISPSDSLRDMRKKFSVDGKASQRLVGIIEELL